MPTTAFSTYYSRELDVGQLARLMLANAPNASEEGLSDEQRAWVRKDVRCSSCRAGSAQIVRAAKAAGGRGATRQAHFRFVGDDAMDSPPLTKRRVATIGNRSDATYGLRPYVPAHE